VKKEPLSNRSWTPVVNLVALYPELAAELTAVAEAWRAAIEERWRREWLSAIKGTTTHPNT
jgi:hypothetical protein